MKHLTNMDRHVKNLYKELLEESGMNKQFMVDIETKKEELEVLKKMMREKNLNQMYTRRVIENFKLNIRQMIK